MHQYALPLSLPPSFAEGSFFVAGCNHDAHRRITSWPDWPAHALILYGPESSGKSHLAHIWAERAQAKLLADNPAALPEGNAVLENIERMRDERMLLHVYNHAREQHASLLLTSGLLPVQLPFTLPDLTSRLLSLPVAILHPADDALLAATLRKQFADRQLKVEEEVIAYLTARMERSPGAAYRLVEMLDAQAIAEQKAVTVPFVKRILGY